MTACASFAMWLARYVAPTAGVGASVGVLLVLCHVCRVCVCVRARGGRYSARFVPVDHSPCPYAWVADQSPKAVHLTALASKQFRANKNLTDAQKIHEAKQAYVPCWLYGKGKACY